MRISVTAVIASLALLGLATPASAATGPLNPGGMTAPEVAAWLQELGYKATLGTDTDGSPKISSAVQNINFAVYFYDCKSARCAALQFSAGFDLTKGATGTQVNEWNRNNRYMKAYLDDSNDPTVQYDVNVAPGGTYESLRDDFGIFTVGVGDFAKFIGF